MVGLRAGNGRNMRRSSYPAERHPVDKETRLANAKVAAWIKETRHQPQEVPLEASALRRSGSAVAAGITRDDYRQNAESPRESRSVPPP
jgi:hypothetical protein